MHSDRSNPALLVDGPSAEPEPLPDHLIPLPGDLPDNRWALWRTFAVRGAGFPVAEVLRLGDLECAAAADRLNAAGQEAGELRERVLEALRRQLAAAGPEARPALHAAIRRVLRDRLPASDRLPATAAAEPGPALAAWAAARTRAEAAREEYGRAHDAARERLSRELREIARGDRFREAVVWQNRHAAETGIASLLRRDAARRPSSNRAAERMVASYLQRYCTKNDTIGFFGPVAWGRLSEDEETVAVRTGPDLLASRRVFFEGWAIDAVADLIAADAAVRPWLAPRRSPLLQRQGDVWIGAGGHRIKFGPVSSRLFAACDGTRPARDLVRELIDDPALPTPGEDALYGVLADLHEKGALFWGFQIPLSLTPEATLHELLAQIGDAPLRERALALLGEIVAARDALARAAGSAGEVDRALGELEASFRRATGLAPTRAQGMLYSGRMLAHEDCRRDLDLTLGAAFLDDLAPALSLVLAAARWFTHHIALHQREMLDRVYLELCGQVGTPVIGLMSFASRALPGLVNPEVQQELRRELETRWGRVLALPAGARRVALSSAELWPRARAEFAAPAPGWQRARFHSPDLLVAAESLDAFRRGDYEVVLGELHLAVNTLDRGALLSQHPDPARLLADLDADLPGPVVMPLLPKQWRLRAGTGLAFLPGITARLDTALRSARNFYLDLSLDPPGVDPGRLLAIGDLVVEPHGGRLTVAARGGAVRFDLIDFFQMAMMVQAVRSFAVRPAGRHTPRITVDRLVLARETWTFPAAGLDFATAESPAARFAAVRGWAAEHGMPRFLFVHAASERKPFFLDLASPIYVDLFAKAVAQSAARPAGTVTLAEMLPEPDRAWLPDAHGNRYTSELRFVAVDRI